MNIQVSNLCQFLPQDRVADFVKMSNTELLVNTMQAVDHNLYDMHCKLKDAQKVNEQIETEYNRLQENLDREKQIVAALERDVANLEEKQNYEEKLNHLKTKRPWVVSVVCFTYSYSICLLLLNEVHKYSCLCMFVKCHDL